MIVKYAPQAASGVTTLMSVGAMPNFSAPATQKALAVGAGAGLLAALILGSKRTLLFAAAGAVANYVRVQQGMSVKAAVAASAARVQAAVTDGGDHEEEDLSWGGDPFAYKTGW